MSARPLESIGLGELSWSLRAATAALPDSVGRKLRRALSILWRTPESVLVRDGLKESDLVVTSRLSSAVPGMLLRLASAPGFSACEPVRSRAWFG